MWFIKLKFEIIEKVSLHANFKSWFVLWFFQLTAISYNKHSFFSCQKWAKKDPFIEQKFEFSFCFLAALFAIISRWLCNDSSKQIIESNLEENFHFINHNKKCCWYNDNVM